MYNDIELVCNTLGQILKIISHQHTAFVRKYAENSEAQRQLGEIGEILSRGVELLLRSREQSARLEEVEQVAETIASEYSDCWNSLLELVQKFGSISTADAMEKTGMSRSTASRRLAKLVGEGTLVAKGKGRGARYILPDTARDN